MVHLITVLKYFGVGLFLVLLTIVTIFLLLDKGEEETFKEEHLTELPEINGIQLTAESPRPKIPSNEGTLSESFTMVDEAEQLAVIWRDIMGLSPENLDDVLALVESQFPKTPENTSIYEAMLAKWATFAGHDAVTYAMSELEGDLRLDAGVAAARTWGLYDAAYAADILENLPDTHGKDYLVYDFAYTYVDKNPDAAMEWVRALPGGLKKNATYHAYRSWLEKDDIAATDWLVKNIDFGIESTTLEAAAVHWARKDLKQLDKMIEQLPGDLSKTSAMSTVVDWLAIYQPEQVANWLNGHHNSRALNPVLGQFALSIATTDYESALSWAEGITSEEMSDYFVNEVKRINHDLEKNTEADSLTE